MNQRNKIKPIVAGALIGLLLLVICFAFSSTNGQSFGNITANSTNQTTDLSGDPAMQGDNTVPAAGNISEADLNKLETGDAAWLSAVTDLTEQEASEIMQKKELIYEGKAKKVYATDDPELLIVDYKDDATAFNGLKKGTIRGKGIINNRMSNRLMQRLEREGVPTHFVKMQGLQRLTVHSRFSFRDHSVDLLRNCLDTARYRDRADDLHDLPVAPVGLIAVTVPVVMMVLVSVVMMVAMPMVMMMPMAVRVVMMMLVSMRVDSQFFMVMCSAALLFDQRSNLSDIGAHSLRILSESDQRIQHHISTDPVFTVQIDRFHFLPPLLYSTFIISMLSWPCFKEFPFPADTVDYSIP